MRVCFLLERGSPPRLNPILVEVFARLEKRGIKVAVLYPEEALLRLDTLQVEADLYLLKSDTELALSLAVALESLGARVLNSSRASALAKDKVQAAVVLQQAGLPAPRSWTTTWPAQLASELVDGPLIFKPHRGYHGAGIAVAETASVMPKAEDYPGLAFVQRYLARARTDLKVFAMGEDIFGVRKAFASNSFLQMGTPSPLSSAVEEIARRCGRAFGLTLYGLDIAEDEMGAHIVDVNYFPGYRGVPGAALWMADYIESYAREQRPCHALATREASS